MNNQSIFKTLTGLLSATILLLSACSSAATPAANSGAAGGTASAGNVTVKDAWVRAALVTGSDAQSAGYMTIENKGAADTLLSVSTDTAAMVELHETKEMSGSNGMMSMEPLPNGLDIPANGSVTLKPGSFHLMIMKIKKEAFTPGRTVKLALKFKSGTELSVDAAVRENN